MHSGFWGREKKITSIWLAYKREWTCLKGTNGRDAEQKTNKLIILTNKTMKQVTIISIRFEFFFHIVFEYLVLSS